MPVRLIGTVMDISAQKTAEARLVASEARFREINEAQKRFVSDAAHELRAPLTSIQGNLELLRRHPDVPEEERTAMVTDAARLGRLVTDLLALARGDTRAILPLSPLKLHEVLAEAWQTARPLAEGRVLPRGSLEAAVVDGHRDRLSQLALILLENALKYSSPGGWVVLESAVDGDALEVVVRVQDNGPGIAPEDMERVFERFYHTDRSRSRSGEEPEGTGLGLSIARWIVEQHGGRIWLESEVGVGATAVVRLPVASWTDADGAVRAG
jgi:signal transduction histidine kinase